MNIFYYKFLLITIFNVAILSGQSEKSISKERYNILYDSLSTVKKVLLLEKDELLSKLDSLKNLLGELNEKIVSSRIDQLVKKYGKKYGMQIGRGQVWKGMSEKMLEDSWGKPDRITKNKEKWGTFTQWYFGNITYFFRDGLMTDWEEKKD